MARSSAVPLAGGPRCWLAALLSDLRCHPYWSARRRSLRDVVVRVLLRRAPATPLPPKTRLPLSEYVYCYGPLDPDDPGGPCDWHWEPRKDYFDRSAEATLEYYAPMSSSTSVNELPRSRRSSLSARRPGSRPSGSVWNATGAQEPKAGEFETRIKHYQEDETRASIVDISPPGTRGRDANAWPAFQSPSPRPARQPGLPAHSMNLSRNQSPLPRSSSSRNSAHVPPLKSILKTPKTSAPPLRSMSPPSPIVLTQSFAPITPSPPPPPMPVIPPPPEPFIPSIPSPPPLAPAHSSPPSAFHAPPPPSSPFAHPTSGPFSPPLLEATYPDHPFAQPQAFAPPSPLLHHPHTSSPSPSPRPPRHKRVDHYPPGYSGGISSLLSPGELVFSFRAPHALLRRRLNLANRFPVAFNSPELAQSAFYPPTDAALLLLPELPWAISLRVRERAWLSVGDVLGGLREHLARSVSPAERELLRAEGQRDARVRGDVFGEREWLLGVWEDADAVQRVMHGREDVVQGRRCFVVLFGGEEDVR
ncbi:hypothetical protein AURDEDRAFT_152139 [Auricularia subglabra TFB-10046 SS5]|nr:hypothetical protein AURDEDRAFT_152139 [Auricularia subglabra TFB-10046 SS5]